MTTNDNTAHCNECDATLDPVWETEGYCAKCLDALITQYENRNER